LATALLNGAQAAFTGREEMKPNSVTLVFSALFRSILSPVLVFVGFGVPGAVVGFTAGTLGGGLVGVILMMEIYHGLRGKNVIAKSLKIWETMKFMFRYGLPLSFSTIFTSFLTQFYNVIIAIFASNFLIGNFAVANNFTVLLAFFSTPITTMLFPAFSKLDPNKDKETLKIVFKSSVKYSTLLVVPPTVAVIALANPIVSALFGANYANAPLYLALLSTNYILTAFGNLSTFVLISGLGKTKFYLELAIINTVAGVLLAFLLVPTFGVIGLIITTVFDGVPGLIISLYWVKTHYDATVDWVSSAKILASSGVAGALTFFAISPLSLNHWLKLIFGLAAFAAVFILIMIAIRALKKPDFDNLRLMASELGPLTGIINRILNILERVVRASPS
jgi:O-antigen/teichoic acid export membrane protein